MAFCTIAVHNISMHTPGLFRDHRMAFGTDLVDLFAQELTMRRGMRVMATSAVALFQRRMHEWVFHLLLKLHVAGETDLSFRTRLQLEIVLWEGG
jgi:hypothetical protein